MKTPEELIENFIENWNVGHEDKEQKIEFAAMMREQLKEIAQCQQDNAELKTFWINLSEKKPNCYETGSCEGKKSQQIFLRDDNGNSFVGLCYQGTMDGSQYCSFYDENDFEVENITHWAEIPSLI